MAEAKVGLDDFLAAGGDVEGADSERHASWRIGDQRDVGGDAHRGVGRHFLRLITTACARASPMIWGSVRARWTERSPPSVKGCGRCEGSGRVSGGAVAMGGPS